MVSVEKNMSFLKQSDGTMWNFSYDKNLGIIYKIYKENKWSNYDLLTSKTKGKYSVALLQNDTICVVYENFAGEVIMKLYTNEKWNHYYIVTNDDKVKIDVNFKTIVYENHLFIFFSVYNKDTNLVTIYSNLIDEKGFTEYGYSAEVPVLDGQSVSYGAFKSRTESIKEQAIEIDLNKSNVEKYIK